MGARDNGKSAEVQTLSLGIDNIIQHFRPNVNFIFQRFGLIN